MFQRIAVGLQRISARGQVRAQANERWLEHLGAPARCHEPRGESFAALHLQPDAVLMQIVQQELCLAFKRINAGEAQELLGMEAAGGDRQ